MAQAEVRVVSPDQWGPPLDLVTGGRCLPVIWPGMGARERSLHHFTLPKGAGIHPLQHPSESVYYVITGEVAVSDLSEGSDPVLVPTGGMFHVESGTTYVFESVADESVVIGGPCPADDLLYAGLVADGRGD